MVQSKPVNERLRHLGGTSKLVLDVLTFDQAYMPAMLSICGYACHSLLAHLSSCARA